jgi:hypothetical protein
MYLTSTDQYSNLNRALNGISRRSFEAPPLGGDNPESLRLRARSLPHVAWERWMPICGSRGPHAGRPQFRTFRHQLSHLMDFPDPRFARVLLRRIIQPRMAELGPAFEYFIHAMARRLQIGTDGSI